MLPILTELRHALDMQVALETLVEEGNFSKVPFYSNTIFAALLPLPSSSFSQIILFYSNVVWSCILQVLTNDWPVDLQAFQVLSEYLQIMDSLSQLSAVQEMSHGVEVKLTHDNF